MSFGSYPCGLVPVIAVVGRSGPDADASPRPPGSVSVQAPHQFGSSGEPGIAAASQPPASRCPRLELSGDPERGASMADRRSAVIVRFIRAGSATRGVALCGELTRRSANQLPGPPAAMPDRDAAGVGDRDAQLGVRAGSGEVGKVAAQVGVEDTQPVRFSGAVCEAEQSCQRDNQVRQDRARPGLSRRGMTPCEQGHYRQDRGLGAAATAESPGPPSSGSSPGPGHRCHRL